MKLLLVQSPTLKHMMYVRHCSVLLTAGCFSLCQTLSLATHPVQAYTHTTPIFIYLFIFKFCLINVKRQIISICLKACGGKDFPQLCNHICRIRFRRGGEVNPFGERWFVLLQRKYWICDSGSVVFTLLMFPSPHGHVCFGLNGSPAVLVAFNHGTTQLLLNGKNTPGLKGVEVQHV